MKKRRFVNFLAAALLVGIVVFTISGELNSMSFKLSFMCGIIFGMGFAIYDKLDEISHQLKGEAEEHKSTVPVDNAPTQKEVNDG